MLGTLEWPEFKRLWGTSINNNVKLELTFTHIPKDLLIERPDPELWIDNPGGVLRPELNAFHQKLWNSGNKLRLNVYCTQGYVTPEGGDPITMKWPLDVHVD
jgi:hypothetical protein